MAVGFGITVTMWGTGYAGRLPAVLLPASILLPLLLGCVFCGGFVLGRSSGLGWRHGAGAGGVAGLLNLLVLGSFLTRDRPQAIVPSALLWIPGSIVLACLLSGAGAAAGRHRFPRSAPQPDWLAVFVWIAAAAAALLLAVGGLVTSTGAGLAVTDWPNSFGYNLFLYPFSRMTGAIYYEHAHRLFGALVGLTTLALAVLLQRTESRSWVRRWAWLALLMVVVQGVLGGLRVTGRFTWSSSPLEMRPSLTLAMVHGVLAQLFFATLVALATFESSAWKGPAPPLRRSNARTDHVLCAALVAVLLGQLVLGAVQRHLSQLLMLHAAVGLAMVAPLAIHVGFRAWGLNAGQRLLQRMGLGLVAAVALQVGLGLAAFAASGVLGGGGLTPGLTIAVTTAHQGCGAILLALSVSLACWSFRLLAPRN